ncbi:MAG TPA: chorismate synthase, partial [Thermoleophilia bacterium]|nr:chorismate synthase [Thermoleophilia bacterium]
GEKLSPEAVEHPVEALRVPRPGHADLAGELLYRSGDLRDVIERASARETAARVACGAVARRLLAAVGCTVHSHVVAIGGIAAGGPDPAGPQAFAGVDDDPVRCLDPEAGARMQEAIRTAGQAGDTLGGVFEVMAFGYPAGVGSYAQADRRLGGRLAAVLAAIQAIKGVEIGLGFGAASLPGSRVHDEITWTEGAGYGRTSNHAGGIEGGISTGLPIVVRAAMKPISTLLEPLASVTLGEHQPVAAHVERSDVCAVPAAAIVGEAVVALCLAAAALERFGGATVDEFVAAVAAAREHDLRS